MKNNMHKMETQNPNRELLEKIKEKITKETPKTRGYAKVLSFARIVVLITLVILSVIMLSLFISDIVERFQGQEFDELSFTQNIAGFAFGFLIVSLLATLAIYIIYRGTDWPFVKERAGILFGSFLFIVLLSGATVMLSENETTALGDFLDGLKDRIEEKLSLKSWLEGNNLDEIRKIEGTILSVEKDGRDWVIIVSSEKEEQELTLEHRFGEFLVGDKVKIEYEVDREKRDVEKIERK